MKSNTKIWTSQIVKTLEFRRRRKTNIVAINSTLNQINNMKTQRSAFVNGFMCMALDGK